MRRIILAILLTLSTSAQAFTVAGFSPSIDPNRETHVLVVGRGKEMGRQFAQAALGKALRLRETSPQRQVVVISIREKGNAEDGAFFQRVGLNLYRHDTALLSGKVLVQELKKLGPLASLEFFSHSGWAVGPGLEGGDYRFNLETAGIKELAGRFTPDAFMILHGCNSGYLVAPGFSKLWGIPAAGSLGATDFQQLHSNGTWYHHNPGQFPAGGWAAKNAISYDAPVECNNASNPCYRMKPDNSMYQGVWGKFWTGLGFYKFFCARGEDEACLRGVRAAVVTNVSIQPGVASMGRDAYKALVKDWLCGNSASGTARRNCEQGLDTATATGQRSFTTFSGNSLVCDLAGCSYEYTCKKERTGGWMGRTTEVCGMVNTSSAPSTALVDDFDLLMRAYDAR
jgi:hypothetical protein